MKRRTLERTVAAIYSSGGTLYVNGEMQRGICTQWVRRLLGGDGHFEGAYIIRLRRGLAPGFNDGWIKGRITRGQRRLYAHTIVLNGAGYAERQRGRVPHGPINNALRALIGKSPEMVVWRHVERVKVES